MNYFAKFEKFLPHNKILPSFMTVGSQMPELDWGEAPPPYKLGSQNTPYKLGLTFKVKYLMQSPEKLKPTLINSMSRRLPKLVLFSNKPLETTKFCEFTLGFF